VVRRQARDGSQERRFSVTILAVQYLEPGPHLVTLTPGEVRAKLRAALAQLPISLVLLGWQVPQPLLDVCREEAARTGARLFRWQPLLTGDGTFMPRPEWRAIGLSGEPAPGFHNMPEFTFACPNQPAVREAVRAHLQQVIKDNHYAGFFLDRIRYPSPAADPARWLACFCPACHRAAAEMDFDLAAAHRHIKRLLAEPEQTRSFIHHLLDPAPAEPANPATASLQTFLNFRALSITRFIQAIAAMLRAEGLAVGLDCFSPALTHLVGQDLAELDACAAWTKVMTYAHTLGPAGLPFELLGLANWLVAQRGVAESQAMAWLAQATRLPLPLTRVRLQAEGVSSEALQAEIKRARQSGLKTLLAGLEFVELEGVAQLRPAQIGADLQAVRLAGADGLVLSWDLWAIPLERLRLIQDFFLN